MLKSLSHVSAARWGGVSLVLLLAGCSGLKSAPVASLASADLDRLTYCDSAPSAVQVRLQRAGYRIDDGPVAGFVTDFKPIEEETESYLLGATSDEYLRQYRVLPEGSGARLEILYRHIRYPHSGDVDKGDIKEVSTGPRQWRADQKALLESIHAEACGGAVVVQPVAPAAQPGATPLPVANSTLDYLLGKCRGGDEVACNLLRDGAQQ